MFWAKNRKSEMIDVAPGEADVQKTFSRRGAPAGFVTQGADGLLRMCRNRSQFPSDRKDCPVPAAPAEMKSLIDAINAAHAPFARAMANLLLRGDVTREERLRAPHWVAPSKRSSCGNAGGPSPSS
jgi:hypothetical protein